MARTDTSDHAQDIVSLRYYLVKLLHGLLIGHMKDPDLDVGELLQVGLEPVLRQWALFTSTAPSLSKLALAFLKRWMKEDVHIRRRQPDYDWSKVADTKYAQMHRLWELYGELPFVLAYGCVHLHMHCNLGRQCQVLHLFEQSVCCPLGH